MVAYHDLYDCRVDQWQKTADDWVDLARRSSSACEDIRAQGKKPLDDHWADATGKQAGKRLEDLADRLESGGDIMKGVAMVLDALAHTMGCAQRTLSHAIELANENGLGIQDGRAVGAYTGAAPVGPNVPQNVRDAYTQEQGHIATVNTLIDEALREASQADAKASAELDELAKTINVSDTSQAHNEILVEASHIEFDILRADIPVGKDPRLVRAWWDGLTPQQQKDLMRADPVTLADLGGLAPEVERELRGPDGKIDRVEMVRYALDHWNKKDDLDYGDVGNCTNFVSSSLEAGGVKKKISPWTGLMGDDTWGRQSGTGWDWFDQNAYHSDSWARAKGLQNFLLRHGSKEVPRTEARPGDIVFYEQVAPRHGNRPWRVPPRRRRHLGLPRRGHQAHPAHQLLPEREPGQPGAHREQERGRAAHPHRPPGTGLVLMAATSPSPSSSPATSGHPASRRAVTLGTVTAAGMVPLLIVTGVATSLHTQEIQHEWADRQREACRHLPFPMTEYAAGWAGVALGVAAVAVCVLLARRLRGRYGLRLGQTRPGLLAGTTVWFCVLAIPMELIQLWVVYSAAAAGINLGDGC